MIKSANISECGLFRYTLERVWDWNLPVLFIIMLNPSTADASTDDPTIRRCVKFAKREGFGCIVVVNLHAFRATQPEKLKRAADPFGPRNDDVLRQVALMSIKKKATVLCAWGASGNLLGGATRALNILNAEGVELACLGVTANGMPRHPLYVRGDQPFVSYTRERL